jgi:hypothetical protein
MEGMTRPLRLLPVIGLLAALSAPLSAQEPQSAAPAKALAQLLAERKLDSFAVRLPTAPDEFAATLAFPGQLIVVWAKFSAPAVLNEKIINRAYRDAYIDLNSATDPATRHFVTDLGADGMRSGGKNQPADSHDIGAKSIRFDGSWREDKMSEKEYQQALADADAAYAKVLGVLLEQLKKAS